VALDVAARCSVRDRDDEVDLGRNRRALRGDPRFGHPAQCRQLFVVAVGPHHGDVELRHDDADGPAHLLGRELGHPVEAVAGERRVHHQLVNAADPLDEGRKAALGYRMERYSSSSHGLTCTR
jgi:hypothetical protein